MNHYDQWRVAVVDDDQALADLIREGLEAEGYQTATFASAATFLQTSGSTGCRTWPWLTSACPTWTASR
ncbi:MAG: hypothetical protein AB1435_15635 [Chloroflexota bacterium]